MCLASHCRRYLKDIEFQFLFVIFIDIFICDDDNHDGIRWRTFRWTNEADRIVVVNYVLFFGDSEMKCV